MKRISMVITALLFLFALALPAAARGAFPDVIELPTGFAPEGVATGSNHTIYAGSLADGAIVAADLRTGQSDVLVPGEAGRISVGMSVDARSGYLFVAGGPGAVGRVYDTASGAQVAEYAFGPGFINDVIVTREAAYFTNSFAPEFYRVPLGPAGSLPGQAAVETIPLSGDWVQAGLFNANGIVATADGSALIIVNSGQGALYRVDPTGGEATEIDLGGAAVPFGDGLVLAGRTLYVVQNQLNQIGVISLSPDLSRGSAGEPITNALFNVPTTAAEFGNSLYAVNAKFGTPADGTPYEIVRVPRR